MRKTLIAAAIAGAFCLPSVVMAQAAAPAAAAPASPHTFSPNVGVVSDYLFRGISQSKGGAALQGGIDYSHSSGLYAGVWVSTITWVKQYLGSGSTEIDLYGGYKSSIGESDWSYDVGLIAYNYTGQGVKTGFVGNTAFSPLYNPNTTEVYGALSYKWLTLKYSHTVSNNFIGWVPYRPGVAGNFDFSQSTRGSNYLELNAAYDLGDGWGISGHVGAQKVKNIQAIPGVFTDASYRDWNIGVTKDVGFGVVGLTYSDTNVSGTCNGATGGTNPYCWGDNMNQLTASGFKDAARGTAVLSFKKTF